MYLITLFKELMLWGKNTTEYKKNFYFTKIMQELTRLWQLELMPVWLSHVIHTFLQITK